MKESKLLDCWHHIKNYPDYMINTKGEILSLKYKKPYKLKLSKSKIGYLMVTLNSYDKKYVHHLMSIQFLNHIPTKQLQINHIDGNKTNNVLNNLEIVTPKQNTRHAIAIGIHKNQKGQNNYSSKLLDFEITQIRNSYIAGQTITFLANKYSVSYSTIFLIVKNKTWRHI